MSAEPGVVIVGAGQAGARCASILRRNGYGGAVTLIGAEAHLPYERPPLSKQALIAAPQDMAAHVPSMFPAEYFVENDIDLKTAVTVEAIDIAGKTVHLRDASPLPYTTLVLATGSRPRPYHRTDMDDGALFTLRNVEDAQRLRAQLRPERRLLLIGGGFIGLEIAAAAADLGCSITVIESQDRILKRSLSSAAAAIVGALHESRGVAIRTRSQVTTLAASEAGIDYVLNDGTRGQTDIVVPGIGGIPNAELAVAAGLAQCSSTGGILIDERCRTSAPNVYAIGDVASEFNAYYGVQTRLESWENAETQAMRAAIDIAGESHAPQQGVPSLAQVPWFWTDQYDVNLQIVGLIQGAERHVERRGTADKRMLFHFHGSRLLGAELFNSGRERRVVRQLVALGEHVDDIALADGSLPLTQILAKAQSAATANGI